MAGLYGLAGCDDGAWPNVVAAIPGADEGRPADGEYREGGGDANFSLNHDRSDHSRMN
jgi:hypothetical protein